MYTLFRCSSNAPEGVIPPQVVKVQSGDSFGLGEVRNDLDPLCEQYYNQRQIVREEWAMRLRGKAVIIRPQVRQDLDIMRAWRPFTDPLLATYNLPSRSSAENDARFAALSKDPTRRWYTIEDLSGQVIGRISLREIDGRRSARLGITIGADWVGRGYGTDALRTFLDYYFGELGFATLYLDVAAPNRRAIRCYEKCGFRRAGEEYRDAGTDTNLAFLRDKKYRHVRHFFVKKGGGKNQVLFYEMRLDRRDWAWQRAKELGQDVFLQGKSASNRRSLSTRCRESASSNERYTVCTDEASGR